MLEVGHEAIYGSRRAGRWFMLSGVFRGLASIVSLGPAL